MKKLAQINTYFAPIERRFILLATLIPIVYLVVFVHLFAGQFPIQDDLPSIITNLLLAMHSGEFTLWSLWIVWNGHQPILTLSTSALFMHTTNWRLGYELAVLVGLGIINSLLLILMLAKHDKKLTVWLAPLTTTILLATQYGILWLSSIYSQWHYATLFIFLAILVMLWMKQGWLPIVISGFFGLLALFSFANGIFAWPSILVMMIAYSYRKIHHYLLWSLLFAGTMYVYLSGTTIGITTDPTSNNQLILSYPIPDLIHFLLLYLGGPIAVGSMPLALVNSLILLVFFVINTLYLIAKKHQSVAIWFAIAMYGGGSGVMIAFSRLHFGMAYAITERYTYIASFFLLAVVILAALAIDKGRQPSPSQLDRAIVHANTLALIYLVAMFIASNAMLTSTIDILGLTRQDMLNYNACMEDYPLSRDANCGTYFSDLLVAYDLMGYARMPKTNVLPQPNDPNTNVIITSSDRTLAYSMSRWLLDGFSQDDILYHLTDIDPDLPQASWNIDWATLDPAPVHVMEADTPDTVDDFLATTDTLWLLSKTQAFPRAQLEDTYALTDDYALFHTQRLDFDIQLLGYRKINLEQPAVYRVDDTLETLGWHLIGGHTATACAEISIDTYWQALDTTDTDYGISIVIADEQGVGVAHADATPIIPTTLWDVRTRYADRKTLSVPCEPGQYSILFGAYLPDPYQPVPLAYPDGNPAGNLVYLTQLQVSP